MVDFDFSVLWKLASSVSQVTSWLWGEIKRLKENLSVENGREEDLENGENVSEESSHVENGREGSSQVENGSEEDLGNGGEEDHVDNGSEVSSPVVIGVDAYEVACNVAVCMDPFFLYIPFLSYTKMCIGMSKTLWKVAVALRTVADISTALILLRQLSGRMSSIKSIFLICVKFLLLAPIPQILLSEMFILKTLGGYRFWNLILFCHYGARLVLIFQSCEQLKMRVFAEVDLFLYVIISHVIGASWYYLSIKRQLSCWNYACKIITECIFHCDGTTPSTLNSTLVNEFCPINPPNATVFNYGIYLDAIQSGLVEDKGVRKKFLQCFFWGLRNLSSFASNLQPSRNAGEIFFATIICAVAVIFWRNGFRNPQTEEGTSVPREIESERVHR